METDTNTPQNVPARVTLNFSEDSLEAIRAIIHSIDAIPQRRVKTVSNLGDAERSTYKNMLSQLLPANPDTPATYAVLDLATASELLCTLKAGLKTSVNQSSVIKYAVDTAKTSDILPFFNSDLQALKGDLDRLMKDNAIDFKAFSKAGADDRYAHMTSPERVNTSWHTSQGGVSVPTAEVLAIVNTHISARKKTRLEGASEAELSKMKEGQEAYFASDKVLNFLRKIKEDLGRDSPETVSLREFNSILSTREKEADKNQAISLERRMLKEEFTALTRIV